MLAKLVAGAFVVGIIPVAILVAGGVPNGPRKDLVPFETRTTSAEEQWRDQVGAICGWQRRQVKLFSKAFRHVATPIDVEFALKSAMRMIDESRAIFSRLDPPFDFQRESRTLVRLLRSERASLAATLEAFKDRKRAAFVRNFRSFVRADTRASGLLNQFGGAGCRAKPVTVPNRERVQIV